MENNQFQKEYLLAMKLIGERCYCWKRNENIYEVGQRIEIPGQTSLGYDVWGAGASWEIAFAQAKERYEKEKTSFKNKRIKKMNNLKIKDPKNDGYIVYVHPRQSFSLELSMPDDPAEYDDWQVEIYSDYFFIDNFGFYNGCKIYNFTQFYDLSEWAKISNVQIAEVLIRWKGAKKPGFESRNLFVVLQGHKGEQRDIVTVINPIATTVKIQPHQLLEVVVFDHDGVKRTYNDNIHLSPKANQNLYIEKIGTKRVKHVLDYGKYQDSTNDEYLINRHTFNLPINPKIIKDTPKRKLPEKFYYATHFFYQMSKKCIPEVQKLANGSYENSEIEIYDDFSPQNGIYFDVNIAVKGSLKFKLKNIGSTKIEKRLTKEQTTAIEKSTIDKILTKKTIYEKDRKKLFNPSTHDNIEFTSSSDYLIIEIGLPKLFNEKCPEQLQWTVMADPVWQYRHEHQPQFRLEVMPSNSKISGLTQKFVVSPAPGYAENATKHAFLGIVKFIALGFENMTRCVSFYIKRGESVYFSDNSTTQYSSKYTPPSVVQTKLVIKFEESITDDLMVIDTICKKFFEIKIENNTTYNNKGVNKKNNYHSER